MDREARLRELYRAFNDRDVDAALAGMTPDVDWPNGWEGGRVVGREAVREYWTRQWAEIDPSVDPVGFAERRGGEVEVRVHQVARDLDGRLLFDAEVRHVYAFRGELVERMTILE